MSRAIPFLIALLLAMPALSEEGEVRPYDDSDPEMNELLDGFFDLTPCGAESGLCPEALALLSVGGDRLAAYLITQLTKPEPATGPIGHGTYTRLLGYTESTTAYLHLMSLVEERADALEANPAADSMPLIFAIEGLGNTRKLGVIPIAFNLLDRFADPAVTIRALNALDCVQSKHGPQPEIRAKLEALQAESAALAPSPSPTDGLPSGSGEVMARAAKILANPGATYP
jgi:hypothetical protein